MQRVSCTSPYDAQEHSFEAPQCPNNWPQTNADSKTKIPTLECCRYDSGVTTPPIADAPYGCDAQSTVVRIGECMDSGSTPPYWWLVMLLVLAVTAVVLSGLSCSPAAMSGEGKALAFNLLMLAAFAATMLAQIAATAPRLDATVGIVLFVLGVAGTLLAVGLGVYAVRLFQSKRSAVLVAFVPSVALIGGTRVQGCMSLVPRSFNTMGNWMAYLIFAYLTYRNTLDGLHIRDVYAGRPILALAAIALVGSAVPVHALVHVQCKTENWRYASLMIALIVVFHISAAVNLVGTTFRGDFSGAGSVALAITNSIAWALYSTFVPRLLLAPWSDLNLVVYSTSDIVELVVRISASILLAVSFGLLFDAASRSLTLPAIAANQVRIGPGSVGAATYFDADRFLYDALVATFIAVSCSFALNVFTLIRVATHKGKHAHGYTGVTEGLMESTFM